MNLRKKLCKAIAFIITLIFCFSAFGCSQETTPTLFTVSFDYGYNDKVMSEQVEDGSLITAPDAPMRIGYEFDGWWIVAEDEEWQWDFENNIVLENVTLYARWKESSAKPYILKLDPNGGTCSAEQVEVYYNQEYSLPIPKKEGYYFLGWMMTQKRQMDTEGVYTYSGDKSLVAIWGDYPANTIIKMGKFEQDNDLSNGPEELEWQIVKHNNGKYLLISRHILTAISWVKPGDARSNWENSLVCEWLNGEFYDGVFSEEEKEYIYLTDLDEANECKIFCPYDYYISNYAFENNIICCEPTPYALEMGVEAYYFENYDGSLSKTYLYYALRGTSGTMIDASSGYRAGSPDVTPGIRPAMWVSEEFVESFIK